MENRILHYRELSGRIEALFDQGHDQEGTSLLEAAIKESEPDPAYNLFFRSEAAGYIHKDFRRHKKMLVEANRLQPDDYFLVRNMAVCLILLEKEKEAMAWLRRALSLNCTDYATMRYMGLALSNRKREHEAIEWYEKALAVNPDDYDSVRQIGVSLSKRKRDNEAIDWYRKALAIRENDYDSMRQLGISLASLGKYAEAVEWLNRALEINGKDAEAHRNLKIISELHAEARGELWAGRRLWRLLIRLLESYGSWLLSCGTSRRRGL